MLCSQAEDVFVESAMDVGGIREIGGKQLNQWKIYPQ